MRRRAARQLAAAAAAAARFCSAPTASSPVMTEPISQPTPFTHPHLLGPNEVTVGVPASEYASRRHTLLSALPAGTVMVVNAYPTKIMTHDIPWPFRQESNFWFLTGCLEPSAVAVLEKPHEADVPFRWTLFVAERDKSRELWDGVMTGTDNAKVFFAPDECLPLSSFEAAFRAVLQRNHHQQQPPRVVLHSSGNTKYEEIVSRLCPTTPEPANHILSALRTFKGFPQIEMHQRSAKITERAFRTAMQCTFPGLTEGHVEAVMVFAARMEGAEGLAYPPVVAGGAAGLSLHYVGNRQVLREGELLLVDAGAELQGHPTDVTRTWPVSGTFSEPQKKVYNAVLAVQKQLLTAAVPGATISNLQRLTRVLLAEEMLKLGVLNPADGSAEDQARTPKLTTLFPHAFGHFMGMDIHETPPREASSVLRPRMMHTIEPGVYIPRDPSIDEQFHGICVRIEDNILIADDGNYVLTSGTPKEVEEVEHCIATREESHLVLRDVAKLGRAVSPP